MKDVAAPVAYKTFIKSRRNELAAGTGRADDARGRREEAAAGCQMILKLFGTVSTDPSASLYQAFLLLESFRTPMAWPG